MKLSPSLTGCVAYLFLMVLLAVMGSTPVIAAGVCDKKPDLPKCNTDPPPDPDPSDICATFSAPDYVFWRDSTSKRVPAVTVFLAESATGCEKELLRVDLSDSGPINVLSLAYSSMGAGDTFFGRIVFEREEWLDSSQGSSVWKYDFVISDGQIQPIEDPVMVLENIDSEKYSVRGLDLSPDTNALVWKLSAQNGDAWNQSIRTVDIDECAPGPCTVDASQPLVQYVYVTDYPAQPTGTYLQNPVWGPFGDRIYFVARQYQPDLISDYVMAIDIASDGSADGPAKEIFGIEDQVPGDPSYRYVRSVASGLSDWPNPGEYLAVEIGEDNYMYSCASIYTLDAAACEDDNPDTICELQYEIVGSFQSWTRTGSIVLSGLGGACKFNQVGIWDGMDVSILTKGYEPEAAALWPY